MPYSVVIAEDFRMIREIFENVITQSPDYVLEASFPTAVQAYEHLKVHSTDLVLMDVLIPGSMNGLDVAELIKKEHPETKVIIVTSMPELSYEKRAREAGIDSFWQKEVQEVPLLEIMNRTMAGENVYPSSQKSLRLGEASTEELTEREIEILRELVTGASNKEIADKLSVETSTVKMHISNMLQKTGYHSRLELAVKARHYGLVIND
ncbi:two-component system, NarL family, vancomycin resistance associated response regulator VraR [Lachnospiraceae bacterium XBB2008]|nr:two-component system, NarL family, vancomycin resistance associated response regulator VraR [Lachnospiraceae bacterium XBB2008]